MGNRRRSLINTVILPPPPYIGPDIFCKYIITDTKNPTNILAYTGGFVTMYVWEGKWKEKPLSTTYQFKTLGEHYIRFKCSKTSYEANTGEAYWWMNLTTIDEIRYGEGLTCVGGPWSHPFNGCSATKLYLPNSITKLPWGDGMNQNTPLIDELDLPNLNSALQYRLRIKILRNAGNCTKISGYATNQKGAGLAYWEKLILPPTLTTIGWGNMRNSGTNGLCVLRSINPPTLGIDHDSGFKSDVTIFVLKDSLESYKTASVWSNYKNLMRAFIEASVLPNDNADADYCFCDNKFYEWDNTWIQII